MRKIAIVTDSAADLPQDIVKELDIHMVPLGVNFSSESYLDGVDINTAEFYQKLENTDELPTTSQATPGELQEVYTRLLKEHDHVISIHISSKLSGTYQSSELARDMIGSDKVTVMDSYIASLGQGMLAIMAAEMAHEGKSVADIVQALRKRIDTQYAIFTIDVLENMVKGGRATAAAGFFGSILKIKPILHVSPTTDGRIEALDKVRGRKKALKKVLEVAKEKGLDLSKQRMAIAHSLAEDLGQFVAMLKETLQPQDVIISNIGPTVGTHTGRGTIALFFTGQKETY